MAARTRRWAVALVIPADFLNTLAEHGIGDGVEAPELRDTFQLPMMGPMEVSVMMTITGVSYEMRANDGGRLRATVRSTGALRFHGDVPMEIPGLVRVSGEVLVEPIIELRDDNSFAAYLDLANSELVATHFEGIDGVDHDAESAAQMSEMLFASVGGDLFSAMAENLGTLGMELAPEQGEVVAELGVAPGRARIRVRPGRMEVMMAAVDGLDGSAVAVDVQGPCIGVGVASGSVAALASALAQQRIGVAHLPFEFDVHTAEGEVGGRLRSTRLVESPLVPDLRPGVSCAVEPRLVDDHVELTLRSAWLDLPLVPAAVNRFNRWVGGMATRAVRPLVGLATVRIPAHLEVPARPDSDVMMGIVVRSLQVDGDGVEAVIAADIG
ncbi:MAG: hypothetical protein IT195_03705 [Microthrixaceae bacterium]|nr:hypothetical protein [Microthrixaceae bacterium]